MWSLAWPLTVGFICRMGMAATDSAFVGHLSNSSRGALLPPTSVSDAFAIPLTLPYLAPSVPPTCPECVPNTTTLPPDPLLYLPLYPAPSPTFPPAALPPPPPAPTAHTGYTAAEYLAAATLADLVVNVLLSPPLAFNQVLNALVGQAVGSANPHMAGTWLQLSMFFLTLSAAPFLVVQYFATAPLLRLLGFSHRIAALAGLFARWSIFWPVPNGLYQCLRFYFQAVGLPRPAMYNSLAFLGLNAALNWLFVFGGPFQYVTASHPLYWRGLGFVGAPISLSCSRVLQIVVYFVYMFLIRRAHVPTWPGWNFRFLRRQRIRRFLVQALPLVGTNLFQTLVYQTTTLLIAQLGTVAVAASSAVGSAVCVVSSGLSAAFSAVTAVRVGHHLGRADVRAARYATVMVVAASVIAAVLLFVVMWPLRSFFCGLITTDPLAHPLAARLVAPSLVAFAAVALVQIGSAVLSGQGRTFVTTVLSVALELPASIGIVVLLVYVVHLHGDTGLVIIFWAQAAVSLFEVAVVAVIIATSRWRKYAAEARQRQEVAAVAAAEEGGGAQQGIPVCAAEAGANSGHGLPSAASPAALAAQGASPPTPIDVRAHDDTPSSADGGTDCGRGTSLAA